MVLYFCVDWILPLRQTKEKVDNVINRIKCCEFYLLLSLQVFWENIEDKV